MATHCRSGEEWTPGKAIGKRLDPPQEERGPGLAAMVQAVRPFNIAILAEKKIHFNARIATKAYYF